MRIKGTTPADLAYDLLGRSVCRVQVAAVLSDSHGLFAWGWNDMGPHGLGLCAERHCLSRANKKRLRDATMWVIGRRKRSARLLNARPCELCQKALKVVSKVMYWNGTQWERL